MTPHGTPAKVQKDTPNPSSSLKRPLPLYVTDDEVVVANAESGASDMDLDTLIEAVETAIERQEIPQAASKWETIKEVYLQAEG